MPPSGRSSPSSSHPPGGGAGPPRPPVLVAVDLSEPSVAALAWALDYVRALRLPLTVLRVVVGPRDPSAPSEWNEVLDAAELDDWLRRNGARLEEPGLTRILVRGEPAGEILRAARELEARLIVLGARTLGWLDRLTEASISRAVLRAAPCPVVICRTGT